MKNSRSIIILTLLKLLGAVLGIVYSIVQVRYFGVGTDIEAYFAASSLVYLITSLSQSGQLAEVFLPEYHTVSSTHGKESGHRAFSVVINYIVIALILFSALFYAGAPYLVKLIVPGFDEATQLLTLQVFRILLLFLVLQVINAFITTLLNAERIYGKAEWAALVNSIVSILCIVLLYNYMGIWSVVVALLAGKIIEFVMSLSLLRQMNMRYYFIFSSEGFNHKRFFGTLSGTIFYVSSTQLYTLVLNASVSLLPQGVFAVFQYAQTIYGKISSILIQPISTVFFTNFSELNSKEKAAEVKRFTQDNLAVSMILGAFTFAVFFVCGQDFIELIWGGEKFDKQAVELSYWFLCTFFITFIFQGEFAIYRKIAVTVGLSRTVYLISALGMLISAAITYCFIQWWSTFGLYWVIIISKGLFMMVPVLLIYFKRRELYVYPQGHFLLKLVSISITTMVLGYFFHDMSISYSDWTYFLLLRAFMSLVLSVGIFLGLLWLLDVRIFKEKVILVLSKVKAKFF